MSKENPEKITLTFTVDEIADEALWPTHPVYHQLVEIAREDHGSCQVAMCNYSISNGKIIYTAYLTDENCLIDMNFDASYVYMLEVGEHIKIGSTRDVENRIKQLQTGNPVEIELLFSKKVFEAPKHENILHGKFRSKRESGEWFRLDDSEIDQAVKYLSKLEIVLPDIKEVHHF